MPVRAYFWLVAILLGISCLGCSSRPSRIRPIDVDPEWLSEQMIEVLDADGSGSLSASETEAMPPVYNARAKYDSDGDDQLSAAELEARFAHIFHPDVGLLPASCRVTRNGRPVVGAEVEFAPPEILEGILPPAGGITDANGTASLRMMEKDMPANLPNKRARLMRPGIYLVKVTHPSQKIPPQFNTETTLGKEVFSEVLNGPPLPVELKF